MSIGVGKGVQQAVSRQKYTLSGTSGTPNIATDLTTSPTNAVAGWLFQSEGAVFKEEGNGSFTQFQDGIEWTAEQDVPSADIWIRGTADSGDSPSSGPALNAWFALNGSGESDRQWRWVESTNGFATTAGTIRVDISTDSGGSTIVATGYYRGVSSVEL